MIVQTAPTGQPHFIITQIDHADVSGVFAAHFGNEIFAPLNPKDALVHVAQHHDDGWEEIDAHPTLDPKTRLPYHLTQTPTQQLIATGSKSPDANEKYHPLSGIISSMHTYGLYHGRYGLSDKIYIDLIDETLRDSVKAMLDAELARQARIKAELAAAGHANLVEDRVLFHNYKLLQFFDTLALYIQTVHPEAVGLSQFIHVPRALEDDVVITAQHVERGVITLDPYPFDVDALTVTTRGRYMMPLTEDAHIDDLGAYLAALPMAEQTYTFIRA
ncbi:DUF3891 family protein [Aggregatilineales bacterium SYSU G02658]